MPLNDSEILVMQTMIMRFNEDESLAWINSHLPKKAKKRSIRVFYRIKGKLKSPTDKRNFDLQKKGLWEQHLERIDQLETIMKFSWQNYHRAATPVVRQRILDSISAIQPLLSAYYSANQEVIEHDVKENVQDSGLISKLPN